MKTLIGSLVAVSALSGTPGKQTFAGIITDEMCGRADHSQMRMGPTDPDCVVACISEHGAAYVLYDGKETYRLSDQKRPEQFAGGKVRVTGTLDVKTKTIRVDSIRRAR